MSENRMGERTWKKKIMLLSHSCGVSAYCLPDTDLGSGHVR